MRWPAFCVLSLFLLTSCGSGSGSSGADGRASTSIPGATLDSPSPGETVPPIDPPVVGEVPDHIMKAVLGAVRDQLADPEISIKVLRAESVVWPDGSLGCPEPGIFYTQALVDGYHIELGVDDQVFDFRVGSVDNFKLCQPVLRP